MAIEVFMPKIGSVMQEGTIGRWLKDVGEKVSEGEPLVEISTEKIVTEITAPGSGYLLKIIANEGDIIPIKGVVGIIGNLGEQVDVSKFSEVQKDESDSENLQEKDLSKSKTIEDGKKVKASPAARKLARENKINLADVLASIPGERCTGEDVISWIEKHGKDGMLEREEARASNKKPIETERAFNLKVKRAANLSGRKLVMARKMMKSISEKPHVTLMREINVKSFLDFRNKINKGKKKEHSISVNVLLLKTCAASLKKFPMFNAYKRNDEIIEFEEINLGFAVASREGLVVPVIKEVTGKTLDALNDEFRSLVAKTKENTLKEEDLQGGTFTITNLGKYHIEAFTPIINPPEIAVLGIGKIIEKPVVENSEIKIAPMMVLSLSFDHCAVDGATAAEFLDNICQFISEPETL